MSRAHAVQAVGAILGEGPIWDGAALWFVDIKAHRVFRFVPGSALQSWQAPGEVGWVLPRASGGMIAGMQSGIHSFDPVDGVFAPLHDPEPHMPENRLNDATTDARGRVWFGSMDNTEQAVTGRLYRADTAGCRDSGLPPVVITNGPAISPDGGTLYHTDTLGCTIWRVPLNDDGTLAPAALFAKLKMALATLMVRRSMQKAVCGSRCSAAGVSGAMTRLER